MNHQNSFKCEFCGGLNSLNTLRNTNNLKKTSYGSIYYNLTISETVPFPKTLYGLKATLSEKKKAFLMLDKIQSDFNISDWDIMGWRKEILEKEREDYNNMEKEVKEEKKNGFTRDAQGNIISPFSSKRKVL